MLTLEDLQTPSGFVLGLALVIIAAAALWLAWFVISEVWRLICRQIVGEPLQSRIDNAIMTCCLAEQRAATARDWESLAETMEAIAETAEESGFIESAIEACSAAARYRQFAREGRVGWLMR